MNHCAIVYHNVLAEETVTVSSEATGFEKENAFDGIPVDYWKPTASPAWIKASGRMPAGMWMGSTTAETLVGTQEVINGDFSTTDVSFWGTVNGAVTIAGDGKAAINYSGATASMLNAPSYLDDETDYEIIIKLSAYTSGAISLLLNPSTVGSVSGTTEKVFYVRANSVNGRGVQINASAFIGDIDYIYVRKAVTDLSTADNGLGVYGSIVKSAVATGAELMGYSGWAYNKYLEQVNNTDLDVGTGSIAYIGWIKQDTTTGSQVIFRRRIPADSGEMMGLYINASGTLNYQTNSIALNSNIEIDDNEWHMVGIVRRSGVSYLYIDGVVVASVADTSNQTISTATLRFGVNHSAGLSLADGVLSLWSAEADTVTDDDMVRYYNDEKGYFKAEGEVLETLISSRATTVDYLGIYGHDLAQTKSKVVLQHSDDDSAWTDVTPDILASTSAPIFVTFTRSSHKYWRLSLTGSVQKFGVIMFGKKLSMQRGLYTGFKPMALASENKPINSESGNGNFLGRSTKKAPINAGLSFNNLTPAWVRANWPQLLASLEAGPFFVLPSPDNFADEPAFCWTSGALKTPSYGNANLMSISLPIKARIL